MFRTAKPPGAASSKPEIWSDGQQFAPFDLGTWARVSGILARRTASGTLGRLSLASANLALGLEEGRWRVNLAALGRAQALIPSRLSVARGLARVSRLQAMAAEVVDHRAEGIAPLEIDDLNAFMQSRRLAAEKAEALRQAPPAPATAPHRPLRKIGKPVGTPTRVGPVTGAAPPVAPLSGQPDQGLATPSTPLTALAVTSDELLAIRLAIASAPEPAPTAHSPGALVPDPVVNPVARRVFSPAQTPPDWYDEASAPQGPRPTPSTRPASRIKGLLRHLARGSLGLIGRGVLAIWRPVKPWVARFCATALGWTGVVLALPLGALQATRLHLQHVDLRYFD